MGNRTLLAAFIFAVLLAGYAAYWVHESDHKTEESGLSCAAGKSLQVFVDVYYPGELRPGDYTMGDDRITLIGHSPSPMVDSLPIHSCFPSV